MTSDQVEERWGRRDVMNVVVAAVGVSGRDQTRSPRRRTQMRRMAGRLSVRPFVRASRTGLSGVMSRSSSWGRCLKRAVDRADSAASLGSFAVISARGVERRGVGGRADSIVP